MLLPKKESELTVSYRNQMSVTVPEFQFRQSSADIGDAYNYGLAFTSGELDSALAALGGIRDDLLALAVAEKEAQLLAELDRKHDGLRYRIFGAMQRGEIDGFREFAGMQGKKAYREEISSEDPED